MIEFDTSLDVGAKNWRSVFLDKFIITKRLYIYTDVKQVLFFLKKKKIRLAYLANRSEYIQ